jgi:hypothetical protein
MMNNTSSTPAMAVECSLAMVMTVFLVASPGLAQTSTQPFPTPIPATDRVVRVNFVEFASLPDIGGQPAQPMLLVDEPATGRMFVNDIKGPLYSVSYDGRTVVQYVDVNASAWGVAVTSPVRFRGFQSFSQGEERRTGQAAGVTGGSAVRPRAQGSDFRAQQGGRHHPFARPLDGFELHLRCNGEGSEAGSGKAHSRRTLPVDCSNLPTDRSFAGLIRIAVDKCAGAKSVNI